MLKNLIKATCIFLCLIGYANTGIILQDDKRWGYTISSFQPIGQSFTAEDSNIIFAFNFFISNNTYHSNTSALKVSLLEGDGLDGNVLGSSTFSLVDNFAPEVEPNNLQNAYKDVDFTDVTLTIGSMYTAIIETVGNSPYWGIWVGPNDSAYLGGTMYESRDGGRDRSIDLSFRITPKDSTPIANVSAPASFFLMILGLALVYRRKTL